MEEFSNALGESYNNMIDKLSSWLDAFVVNIPNLVIAVCFILIAYFTAKHIKRLANKLTRRLTHNPMVVNLMESISMFIYGIVILFIVLSIFNLDGTITKLLATAGVVGLAIGLALQDPMMNLFSGVYLSVKKLYSIGDLIETNGYLGKIISIDLRNTIIQKLSGEEVILPNNDVVKSPLTNYTIAGSRRVTVECGISYGDNLQKVEQIARESVNKVSYLDNEKEIDFLYTEFGGSSINFHLRFWVTTSNQLKYLKAKSEAIIALKNAFDENDISIPFPIRTLDFGIRGGESLSAMMNEVQHHEDN